VAGSKKLPKEDMQFLMDNTNFTKQQIKAWYKGFMVSVYQVYSCLALAEGEKIIIMPEFYFDIISANCI